MYNFLELTRHSALTQYFTDNDIWYVQFSENAYNIQKYKTIITINSEDSNFNYIVEKDNITTLCVNPEDCF